MKMKFKNAVTMNKRSWSKLTPFRNIYQTWDTTRTKSCGRSTRLIENNFTVLIAYLRSLVILMIVKINWDKIYRIIHIVIAYQSFIWTFNKPQTNLSLILISQNNNSSKLKKENFLFLGKTKYTNLKLRDSLTLAKPNKPTYRLNQVMKVIHAYKKPKTTNSN